MITLECNYSKKLGLPGYSSHQYSVSIRTELTDLNNVAEESRKLYRLLQDAVDDSIKEVGSPLMLPLGPAVWLQGGRHPTAHCSSAGKKPAMFTSELIQALRIVQAGDVKLSDLNGSWAGAFGQTQFMPSTYRRLAIDFDADGFVRLGQLDGLCVNCGRSDDEQNRCKKNGEKTTANWCELVRIGANWCEKPGTFRTRFAVAFAEIRTAVCMNIVHVHVPRITNSERVVFFANARFY